MFKVSNLPSFCVLFHVVLNCSIYYSSYKHTGIAVVDLQNFTEELAGLGRDTDVWIGTLRLLSILLDFHSHLPDTMPPQRIIPPLRIPPLGSRSGSSAICVVCVNLKAIGFIPHNARQLDMDHDMCRLCAMNQAEEAAQQRARLVARAWAENEEERIQSGLTIPIPPRIHRICALCHTDYLLPVAGEQSDRCRPCQKRLKYVLLQKI